MKKGPVTFRGGVHPLHREHHGKPLTAGLPIEKADVPRRLVIPLSQHIGAPCECLVSVGDTVLMGQKIGEASGFVSIPVHASCSGKVVSVERHPHSSGSNVMAVILENDYNDTLDPSIKPYPSIEQMSSQEIVAAIREAGIGGMGGAMFPAHVKLSPPPDKQVDTLLINGAECEPFLTADHRLMLERPEDIVYGVRALMRALSLESAYIGIEVNKPDGIESVQKACEGVRGITVLPLRVKYPQGAEKQLIEAATGRQVPSGKLPADAGCVVQNIGTAAAVGRALRTGMPLFERVVTVSGFSIKQPKNLLVRVGTSVEYLLQQCGGLKENAAKVLMGGPMMGIAQYDLSVPVVKGTSGVLAMPLRKDEGKPEGPCLRCGRCSEACPMHLQPMRLTALAQINDLDQAEKEHLLDCMECGCCTYICPARRHMVQTIRTAKRKLIASRKRKG